jgi:hypothetical protein
MILSTMIPRIATLNIVTFRIITLSIGTISVMAKLRHSLKHPVTVLTVMLSTGNTK